MKKKMDVLMHALVPIGWIVMAVYAAASTDPSPFRSYFYAACIVLSVITTFNLLESIYNQRR